MHVSFKILVFCAANFAFIAGAWAVPGTYTVSKPTIKGGGAVLTIQVTVPGVVPTNEKSDTVTLPPINLKGGTTEDGKASAIVAAINAKFGGSYASIDSNDTSVIHLTGKTTDLDGHPIGGSITIEKETGGTEPRLVSALNFAPGSIITAVAADIGFEGVLTGLDDSGAASTFTASFGYDGLTASSSVSYAALNPPTVGTVLTDTFDALSANLPASLRPDLSVDSVDQLIVFAFPLDQTNYFASASTTDTGLGVIGGLASTVPEPASLASFAVAVAALAALGRRRRR